MNNITVMINIKGCLLLSLALIVSYNAIAQDFDSKELEAKIDSLIPSQINESTPGLVLGIVQNGELTFSKEYGLANLANDIPNNSKMVYNAGSVSKQFLGYAFAMLHVQGVLNLDSPASNYLEDWPQFKHTVTLRHLLTHTSGYREAYTMSELAGRPIGVDRLTRKECLEVVRRQPELEFIPGTRHTYNSTAYVILAEILEKTTKMSADEWIETNIFKPLKMNDSQIESHVGEVIQSAAESYSISDEKYTNPKSNRAIFGAADVYASVEDLAKWMNIFRTDSAGESEARDVFLSPFILEDGTSTEYGLGIRTGTQNGLKVYWHIGGHEEFIAQLYYYPDHDLGIIMISNFGRNGWLSATKVAELFLKEHMIESPVKKIKRIDLGKDKLKQFEGTYIANTLNGDINLVMVDESLTINGRTELIPTSQNTFGINGWSGLIEIKPLPDSTTHLTITDGSKESYFKVSEWIPNEEDLTIYTGKYWSDELESLYHLTVKNDTLLIRNRWLGEVVLDTISKDIFKTDSGFYVKFMRDESEKIKGLNINSERTLNIYFQRSE